MLAEIDTICVALVGLMLPLIGFRMIFDFIRSILFRGWTQD